MERDRGAPAEAGPIERLVIIGPSFFSYVEAIAAEFRRRGVTVATFDDRHSNRLRDKIFYRLGLYRHRYSPAARHLAGLAERIEAAGCADVLLTNVEAVDRRFIERLRARGIRVHLYMWDGLSNKPGFATYLELLSSKGSFDLVDAEKLAMSYIPLFAEEVFDERSARTGAGPQADICFCGTVHSSRSRILAELLTRPWARNIKLELMLYYHSRGLLPLKGLTDWSIWKLAPSISSKPYSKPQIAAMFGRSRFVLDVPHPGQSGMTARTFEALRSGARLLTFHRTAANLLPPSLRTRVRTIARIEEAGEIDYAACPPNPPLSPEERYFLSLERFVDQLVEMMRPGIGQGAPATAGGRPKKRSSRGI